MQTNADKHRQTHVDERRWTQGKLRLVCGWMQHQDASRRYMFVQGLSGCTIVVTVYWSSTNPCNLLEVRRWEQLWVSERGVLSSCVCISSIVLITYWYSRCLHHSTWYRIGLVFTGITHHMHRKWLCGAYDMSREHYYKPIPVAVVSWPAGKTYGKSVW